MSAELQNQLEDCAHKLGMPITHLMRMCMRIGMEHYKRINYDEAKCIVDAVEKTAGHTKNPASQTPALNAGSENTSPAQSTPPATASAVKLPPQHIAPRKTPRKKDGTNG